MINASVRKTCWTICLPLAMILSVKAETEPLYFNHLSTLNDLTSSSITDIVQDQKGFIWIATTDGLNRYDGYSVKTYKSDVNNPYSLCDNKINDLFVDGRGHLWIGTENQGLSVYDYATDKFKHYPYQQANNRTLSFRFVTSITADNSGTIWVATLKGLNKYNEENDWFDRKYRKIMVVLQDHSFAFLQSAGIPDEVLTRLKKIKDRLYDSQHAFQNKVSQLIGTKLAKKYYYLIEKAAFIDLNGPVLNEQIRSIDTDSQGRIWLGFERNGMGYFDPVSNQFTDIEKDRLANLHIGSNIYKLVCDRNLLWICSNKGLTVLDITSDRLVLKGTFHPDYQVHTVLPVTQDKAWVGTQEGAILMRLNANKNGMLFFSEESSVQRSSTITSLFVDSQDLLWAGTSNKGVFFSQKNRGMALYTASKTVEGTQDLSEQDISYITVDDQNTIWICYNNGFIELFNNRRGLHQNLFTRTLNEHSDKHGAIRKIFIDSNGNYWVGTSNTGVYFYNTKKHRLHQYTTRTKPSIAHHDVIDIDEDNKGNIWLSLHGGGLQRIHLNQGEFTHYPGQPEEWENELANDWIYNTFIDSAGFLLVGTVDGLSVAHIDTMQFKTYNTLLTHGSKPSHNTILHIANDKSGNYWLATPNGLNHFNLSSREFTVMTSSKNLSNNHILGVVSPAEGEIWFSTRDGLSKLLFNPNLEVLMLKNHEISFGQWQKDWLTRGVCTQTLQNHVIFGGENGFVMFDPQKIVENTDPPPVLVTNIHLFNNALAPERWKVKNNSPIVFKHSENVITFKYTALNYTQTQENEYAYRMEGFDKDWQYVGSKREATYTNLPAGTYRFHVKAANNDDYWNEKGDLIYLKILPPLWKTPWAYLFYTVMAGVMLFVIARIFIVRQKLKAEIKLKEYKARKDHETNTLKMRFFTNISHEIRTPLTLMIGPAEKLRNNLNELTNHDKKFYSELIYNNANKLLKLINQLMDFRKLENNGIQIEKKHGDFIAFTKSIYNQFKEEAKTKKISYTFDSNIQHLFIDYDTDIFDMILVNLISNAFKYTPDNGKISVSLYVAESEREIENNTQELRIYVHDNGIGIPKNKQSEIFTRFYQIKYKENIGTGIGLAFTKELVELLGGTISLQSEENQGAKFTVRIPIDVKRDKQIGSNQDMPVEKPMKESLQDHGNQTFKIIIIDDTPDIVSYLRQELSEGYEILEANNGKHGIDLVMKYLPDLIISDILMPEMDGIELCASLKNKPASSHIPIILLTAKSSEESELEGLKTGADAYIKKPFSSQVLKEKIKNILAYRETLKQHYLNDVSLIPKGIAQNDIDKELLEKATKIVLDNLTNPELGAAMLTNQLAVSKSVLYSKLKLLTGQSINEFIRIVRLKKAWEKIHEGQQTLSEIAYDVGFSSLSYFTRSFSDHFGKPPSCFVK